MTDNQTGSAGVTVGNGGAQESKCPFCQGPRHELVRALVHRVGTDTSFANLWARLDRAERDRDRMLNALQFAMDAADRNGGVLNRRAVTVLRKAIRRVSEVHAIPTPPEAV